MAVDWTEVNKRRISEKSQEIRLYCALKRQDMTPRAFDLARMSVERLLDNIADRSYKSDNAIWSVRKSMSLQDACVAVCYDKQALALARGVVYNGISDDLNLYPITAEKKLLRSKGLGYTACDIPIEEMTPQDIIYVASAITMGENFSKTTMLAVYEWFREIGFEPVEARVFSYLFMRREPVALLSIPQHNLFPLKYRQAARSLVAKGFICELPGEMYCVTESVIA